MASTFTQRLHLDKPAHNDDIDTWDVPVNSNMTIIDSSLGGVTSINVTAISGTVTLSNSTGSPPSYICPIFKLSGVLTANVNYQFPSGIGGIFTVSNATTGAFSITFSSAGGGTTVVVPQGSATIIHVDGTNVAIAVTYLDSLTANTLVLAGTTLTGTSTGTGPTLTAAGSVTLPGGLILKFGYVVAPGIGGTTITFPVAFPTNIMTCWACAQESGTQQFSCSTYPQSASQMQVSTNIAGPYQIAWFAVGK